MPAKVALTDNLGCHSKPIVTEFLSNLRLHRLLILRTPLVFHHLCTTNITVVLPNSVKDSLIIQ